MSTDGIATNGDTPVTRQQCLTLHSGTKRSIGYLRWILSGIVVLILANGIFNFAAMQHASSVGSDNRVLETRVAASEIGLDRRLVRIEAQLDRIEQGLRK